MTLTRHQSTRITRLTAAAIVLWSAGLTGCKTRGHTSDAQAFGWDQDVADPQTRPSDLASGQQSLDGSFCRGLAPGTCLTLVLRIPKSDLVQDIGLSTLALGASSATMHSRLNEACQAAWQDYRSKFQNDTLHPWRKRLVTQVIKMRCHYQFSGAEVAQGDTKLATNEIGFSARLSKFNLTGSTFTGDIRNVGLSVTSTYVQGSFRSTSLFSGKDVSSKVGGWRIVEGLGVAPVEFKQAIDRDISWRMDWSILQKSIEQVVTNGPAVQASVAAFFTQAKSAVSRIGAAGNPAAGSLLMIGMGYNAYRSLCGEDPAACKVSTSQSDKTGELAQSLSDVVPSSDTNELFRLAVIRTVQGVLDQIMVRANAAQLADLLKTN